MKHQTARPDIFSYHDHISFLRDWFSYLKRTKTNFSLRALSSKSSIAVGLLPMVLSGKRELSEKMYLKMLPHLGLNSQEVKFLSMLRQVGQTNDHELRIQTINQMAKLKKFQSKNAPDLKVYEYLTKWFYVAIREMVQFKDFNIDPDWIADRLNGRVSKLEVEKAIEFLVDKKFIYKDETGRWRQTAEQLDCREGLFKVSLGQFHRQMFELASSAIVNTPRPQRYILGHTVALSPEQFQKIKEILDQSIDSIQKIESNVEKKNQVYQIEIAAFPLTMDERE